MGAQVLLGVWCSCSRAKLPKQRSPPLLLFAASFSLCVVQNCCLWVRIDEREQILKGGAWKEPLIVVDNIPWHADPKGKGKRVPKCSWKPGAAPFPTETVMAAAFLWHLMLVRKDLQDPQPKAIPPCPLTTSPWFSNPPMDGDPPASLSSWCQCTTTLFGEVFPHIQTQHCVPQPALLGVFYISKTAPFHPHSPASTAAGLGGMFFM